VASIAVIGAGAVGSYYGALLARAGNDVRFLLRRDLDAVSQNGLQIRSVNGDFRLDDVQAFAAPEDIGVCDWVICSLKATALDNARDLVGPCVGPETRVVALMNGLGVEQRFGEWFGQARVLGAMAFVCINRGDPGIVHHIQYGRLTIGHLTGDGAMLGELETLLAGGGIEVSASADLLKARWEKLCWNIPFNGLSVAAGGVSTRTIMDDPTLRETADRAMREVVTVANADLARHGSEARLDEEKTVAAMFAQTDALGAYRTSMVIDYVLGRPLEVEMILGNPARRARQLGIATPTMDALYALVQAADKGRRGLAEVLSEANVIPT
jgi:2-dehydropantoate 2-reductase